MSQKLCPAFERPGASNVPGPGTYGDFYRSTIHKDPTWVIGKGTRDDQEKTMRRTCNWPPPGSYDPNFRASLE